MRLPLPAANTIAARAREAPTVVAFEFDGLDALKGEVEFEQEIDEEPNVLRSSRAIQLARQDLNLDNLDQNQVCYRYTTGQEKRVADDERSNRRAPPRTTKSRTDEAGGNPTPLSPASISRLALGERHARCEHRMRVDQVNLPRHISPRPAQSSAANT